MKRKAFPGIMFILLVIQLLPIQHIQGHSGNVLTCYWVERSPTIDGYIEENRWDDANRHHLYFSHDTHGLLECYFYVKNDNDVLYLAIDVVDDRVSAEDSWRFVSIYFDVDNDGSLTAWRDRFIVYFSGFSRMTCHIWNGADWIEEIDYDWNGFDYTTSPNLPSNHWTYECEMSVEGFLGNSIVGVSFIYTLVDSGSAKGYCWPPSFRQEWRDPTTYADLELSEGPLQPPVAYIEYISPSPAVEGESVTFTGRGDDPDGYVIEYRWTSSIDGFLSDQSSFGDSTLSVGAHIITLKVKDNDGQWSGPVEETLRIDPEDSVDVLVCLWAETTPTIDGYIEEDEWDDANKYHIYLCDHVYPSELLEAYFYVKSNENHFYFLMDVVGDQSTLDNPTEGRTHVFYFDGDHDGKETDFRDTVAVNIIWPEGHGLLLIYEMVGDDEVNLFDWYGGSVTSSPNLPTPHWILEYDIPIGNSGIRNDGVSGAGFFVDYTWERDGEYYNAYWPRDCAGGDALSDYGDLEFAEGPSEPPELVVFDPEFDGLTVCVNGYVLGAERLHWDWGDGNEEDHWFAACHTYDDYGTYSITVTAYSSEGLTSIETKTIRTLTIRSSSHGYTIPSAGDYFCDEDDDITVTAYPDGGYQFDYWILDEEGDGVNIGDDNPTEIHMDHGHTLKPVFEKLVNDPPTAYIDSISPDPPEEGETVHFEGHGTDLDGYIVEYRWESSVDGYLSDQASFSTSTLSVGTHTITFKVKDDDYQWSDSTTRTLTVSSPPPPKLSITDVYFDNLEIGGTSEVRIMIKNVGEGPFSGGSHYFYFTIKDAHGSTFEGYIRRHLDDPSYEKVIQSGRSKRKVTLPSLAPGERERVTFHVDPDPLTSPSLTFSNRLYVSFAPSIPSSGTRYRDYEPSDVITFSTGQIYECASFVAKLLLGYWEASEFLDPKLAKVLNKYVPSLTTHRSALVRLFSEKPVSFSETAWELVGYLRDFARALSEAYSGSDFLAKLKGFAWNLFLEIGGRGAMCGINMLHWALQVVLKTAVELVQSAILSLTEAISVFADIIGELGGSMTDLLALLSPADVLLRDETGRVAGYYDGTVYEEIDGSIVIIEEDTKFIFVPAGIYDLVINGTGSGNVHCYMILMSENTIFMTQHESTVDIGTTITAVFGDQEQVVLTKSSATEVSQVLPDASASAVRDQAGTTFTAGVFAWLDDQPHTIGVESSATISTPTYNEQTCEISFSAYGSAGSSWQMKVTVPSKLLPENPILQVYVNGSRIDPSVTREADNYVVDFAGHFSIVDIVVRATSSRVPEPFWAKYQLWIVGGITGVILALTVMFFAIKKRKSVLKEKP